MFWAESSVWCPSVTQVGWFFSFLGPKTKCSLRLIVWRWEDNIKRNLKETMWQDKDWLHLSQHRDKWRTVVDMVIKLWLLQKGATFRTSCGTVSL
jgi:hypothetical protein